MITLNDKNTKTIEVLLNQMPISSMGLVQEIFNILNKNRNANNNSKGIKDITK